MGAIRFERLDSEESAVETKEVTRVVPKFVKRKWSNDEDSDSTEYDDDSFEKRPPNSLLEEHEDSYDSLSKH